MTLVILLGCNDFVFVDESGVDEDCRRVYARAKRGNRIHGTKPGNKPKRINVVAGLHGKRHVAVRCYDHPSNSAFFEDWFEYELIPAIPKGSVIILDNASFHRKKQLGIIAMRRGVILLFLPPYSPDLNLIEKSWANLKRWLVDGLKCFVSLEFAIEGHFWSLG